MRKYLSLCISVFLILNILGLTAVMPCLAAEGTAEGASTFDYPIQGDPDIMTDEEFFGLWDESLSRWVVEPWFDYDKFDGIGTELADAAKARDYDKAKELVLDYYKDRKYDLVSPITTHPGKSALLMSETFEKNFYMNPRSGSPISFFTVNNEWEDVEIDLLDTITASVGADLKTFIIFSVDREDSFAEFYSRESAYPIRIELVVNGNPTILYPERDTYVSAGTNSGAVYGDEEVLKAQESGGYNEFDEKTNRTFLGFNLSSLKSGDVITSAKMVLKGRNASGTGEKEMILLQWNDNTWTEDMDWSQVAGDMMLIFSYNKCAVNWDYKGGDNGKDKRGLTDYVRGSGMANMAKLYDYTKDEKYAYTFLRHQMDLLNSVPLDSYAADALDISCHIDAQSENLLRCVDSEYMTPEIFVANLKNLFKWAKWEVTEYFGTTDGNWGSYATTGVYAVLARFQEISTFDDWFEATKKENDRLNGEFVYYDGMCIEQSTVYIRVILSTLTTPLNISKATGMPLPFSDYVYEQFLKTTKCLYYTSSPLLTSFLVGDDQALTYDCQYELQYYYNNLFTDDEELEYVATNGKSGKLPDFTSITYPRGKRTVLRENWEEDALSMLFVANRTGSHVHDDALSVTAYAYGQYLLTDNGYNTYGDDHAFFKAPEQHSLVTMNSKSRYEIDSELVSFETNGLYDFVEYSSKATQDADVQNRSVLFLRNQKFWIVNDYIRPKEEFMNEENVYHQYWQMLPTSNMSFDDESKALRSNFTTAANVMLVPVSPEEFSDVRLEDTKCGLSTGVLSSKKGVYEKTGTGEVTFSTIIFPMDIGEDYDIVAQKLTDDVEEPSASKFKFIVVNKATNESEVYYYYHLNDLTKQKLTAVGDYKTDATTMLVQENTAGEILSVYLEGGTVLEKTENSVDKALFKSNTSVSAIGYQRIGQLLDIRSSALDSDDLADLTVYSDTTVKEVIFNDKDVNFNAKGSYIYFGGSPIIDTGEAPVTPPANTEPSLPTHAAGTVNSPAGSLSPGTNTPVNPNEGISEKLPSNYLSEIAGHWGEKEIRYMLENKIVQGNGESLMLGSTVSRAEFVVMLLRALGIAPNDYNGEFEDVRGDEWYAAYLASAKAYGLLEGSDGLACPNEEISREQMAKMLVAAYEIMHGTVESETLLAFSDIGNISDWALDYVKKAIAAGLLNGMDDNNFNPLSSSLREQSIVAVYRLLTLKN